MRIRLILLIVICSSLFSIAAGKPEDPLLAEIHRWQEYVATNPSQTDDWKSTKAVAEPVLVRAEKAYANGNRLFALHILAAVRGMLAGQKYLDQLPAATRQELKLLEEEWTKVGATLQSVLKGDRPEGWKQVPALVRAVGEVSLSEIKPYYEASVEYGRNTVPDAGFYYIGAAIAQKEFADFSAGLTKIQRSGSSTLSVKNLEQEMDDFEDLLLSKYRPPASIDLHPVFIRVSAMLKQSREMHAQDLDYGALYRLLDARLRLARMTPSGKELTFDEVRQRASEVEQKMKQSSVDHSIGQLFLEMALTEANPQLAMPQAPQTPPPPSGGETARLIFEEVIPHYFRAIESPVAKGPDPKPEVTVTFIRWPYT